MNPLICVGLCVAIPCLVFIFYAGVMYLQKAKCRDNAIFFLKKWEESARAGDRQKCREIATTVLPHYLPAEVASFNFGDGNEWKRPFPLEETALHFDSSRRLREFIERTKPEDFRLP